MHITKILILSLSLCLLTCCDNDEASLNRKKDNPYISFSISLSSENSRSRSEEVNDPLGGDNWGNNDNDEEGTSFDRKVNIVTAVLYEVVDGRLATSIPVGEMADATYELDKLNGTLTISGQLVTRHSARQLEEGQFRLAVFVNAPDIDINHPETASFEQHGIPDKISFTGIPMYGVGNADFHGLSDALADKENPFPIKNSSLSDRLLDIPVLRSMAKVRVKVANALFEERDVKLQALHISRHANKGYVVPTGWDKSESMATLGVEEVMNAFRADNLESYTHNCSVSPSVEEDSYNENSWTMLRFYIPETYNYTHDNIDSDELCLSVEYYSDGDKANLKKHEILFRYYDPKTGLPDLSSKPWDLVRNHIYEFVITGIEAQTGQLQISLNAGWWGHHHLELQ